MPQGLRGRKEGGDLAGAQEWGGIWQRNSVVGFMFVSWSCAQGPCCRSRSRECLIVSSFSIIPTPPPQSFAVLRGWDDGSAFANSAVLHNKHSWVLVWDDGELWWKCFDLHKVLATPFLLLSWLPFPRWMDITRHNYRWASEKELSQTENREPLGLFSEIFHFSKGTRFLKHLDY